MSDKKVLLEEWGKAHFEPPPSLWTLRRLVRDGKIVPPPDLVGRKWYVAANAKHVDELPPPSPAPRRKKNRARRTALYRHFDADGRLLYIGISIGMLNRLKQHHHGSHWSDQIARVEVEYYSCQAEAAGAERDAILSEKPLHNIAHTDPAMPC
jgi:predicted GIY-YIG superfamily endonuclease